MKKIKVFQVIVRFLVNANTKKEALSTIELGTEPYRIVVREVNPSSLKIKNKYEKNRNNKGNDKTD